MATVKGGDDIVLLAGTAPIPATRSASVPRMANASSVVDPVITVKAPGFFDSKEVRAKGTKLVEVPATETKFVVGTGENQVLIDSPNDYIQAKVIEGLTNSLDPAVDKEAKEEIRQKFGQFPISHLQEICTEDFKRKYAAQVRAQSIGDFYTLVKPPVFGDREFHHCEKDLKLLLNNGRHYYSHEESSSFPLPLLMEQVKQVVERNKLSREATMELLQRCMRGNVLSMIYNQWSNGTSVDEIWDIIQDYPKSSINPGDIERKIQELVDTRPSNLTVVFGKLLDLCQQMNAFLPKGEKQSNMTYQCRLAFYKMITKHYGHLMASQIRKEDEMARRVMVGGGPMEGINCMFKIALKNLQGQDALPQQQQHKPKRFADVCAVDQVEETKPVGQNRESRPTNRGRGGFRGFRGRGQYRGGNNVNNRGGYGRGGNNSNNNRPRNPGPQNPRRNNIQQINPQPSRNGSANNGGTPQQGNANGRFCYLCGGTGGPPGSKNYHYFYSYCPFYKGETPNRNNKCGNCGGQHQSACTKPPSRGQRQENGKVATIQQANEPPEPAEEEELDWDF